MKTLFFLAALSLPFLSHTLEFEIQTENEHVRVSKIKLLPADELDWHRDDLYRVLTALKGGTVTRIEQDGSSKQVSFPTGVGVFLPPDPAGQLHRTINTSPNEIEGILVELKNGADKCLKL